MTDETLMNEITKIDHILTWDTCLIIEESHGVETVWGMRVMRVRTRHVHSSSLSRTRLIVMYVRLCIYTYVCQYARMRFIILHVNLKNVYVLSDISHYIVYYIFYSLNIEIILLWEILDKYQTEFIEYILSWNCCYLQISYLWK